MWLHEVAEAEEVTIKSLTYIFCSDKYLKTLNKEYLDHDNYTDIITFPYGYEPIEADIFISLERVAENAKYFEHDDFPQELHRVMVHGLMHMCGYQDKKASDKRHMRSLENKYLALLSP